MMRGVYECIALFKVCEVDISDEDVRFERKHRLNVQLEVWIMEGGEL